MTNIHLTPQQRAYLDAIGRALRCGDPDCACAPVPTDRFHCPVHPSPYVPTLRVTHDPDVGFLSFSCTSGCPSTDIEEALARRGLPTETALHAAAGAVEGGLTSYGLLIPQPADWLWPNRIPMGELTLVAGYPASGKTAVALDVATRVSLGADTPDQPGVPFVRAPVVIAAPLKNPRASLLPRLKTLGADLNLVFHADVLSPVHLADFSEDDHVDSLEDLNEEVREHARYSEPPTMIDPYAPPPPPPRPQVPVRGPSLPVVMNRLANLITRGSAALLVVDQIEHLALVHNARVGHVAGLLNALAARTGAAVLALMHNPAHSLAAAARHMQSRLDMAGTVYTIALVGEDRSRFLVPLSPPMHDALPPIPFNFHDAPPIAWREPISHERLLAIDAAKTPGPQLPDVTAHVCRFLAETLSEGPRPAAEVTRRAAQLGISEHRLRRARAACNVATTRVYPRNDSKGSGYWLWSLPQHNTRLGAHLAALPPEQGRGLLDIDGKTSPYPSAYEWGPHQESHEERNVNIAPARWW